MNYPASSPEEIIAILCGHYRIIPFVSAPDAAAKFVAKQVAEGANYIKMFIEDGSCVGFPGLPVLDDETLIAAVDAAHRLGNIAMTHVRP